jgi:hypothetical protein
VFTSAGTLSYGGALRRSDDVVFTVVAPGDADPKNDTVRLRVVFDYCDLRLRGPASALIGSEGSRVFSLDVRNVGSAACNGVRVSAGGQAAGASTAAAYDLGAARSAVDEVSARLRSRLKVGSVARLVFRARAADDVQASNDSVTVRATVVGVGDSNVVSASRSAISGRASGGSGKKLSRSAARVRSVDVAVRRLGGGCRWVASAKTGKLRSGRGGDCQPAAWLRASGTTSWRLSLRRALPPGRYVVYSRATIGAGFREGRFSAGDRNRVSLKVG